MPFLNKISLDFGIYYDFNQAWFADIGELIVLNSLLYAFMPFIEDFFMVSVPYFFQKNYDIQTKKRCLCFRAIFKSLCCNCCCRRNKEDKESEQKTKKKTLFAYQNLYSGPEFQIHYKYAYMLTITWVTFLFGPGMPILFPIALMGLLIQYSSDQYMLAKQLRKPPVYDESMTKITVEVLKLAPFLYAMMGAWLFSNQQTFYNSVEPNQPNEVMMPSDHNFSQFFTQITPGSVFFIYLFIIPVWMVLKFIGTSVCGNCCCKSLWRNDTDGKQIKTTNKKASRPCCNLFDFVTWCRERSGNEKGIVID